jgi:Gas vesicle synthesis protein GvpL/GvpF
MSTATYLYCLVQSSAEPSLRGAPAGLPGAGRPRAIDAGGGLWLVAADVPLEQYGEKPIELGLKDLAWVSSVAVPHEALVEHLAKNGSTVVPMKLFTLFRSDERALEHVKGQRKRIDRLIERIGGREEWGLRVLLDEVAALRRAREGAQTVASGAPGTAFLLRRKKEHDAAREVIEHARNRADEVFERLAARADDARRRPPPPGEIGKRVLLDAAFLIPRKKTKAFQAAVRTETKKLAGRDYQLTLTGPWPAYTFVTDPEPK